MSSYLSAFLRGPLYRLLIFTALLPGLARAQAPSITGNTCVVPGTFIGPYSINNVAWSTADKWCVTGGTLSGGTANGCVTNPGTPSIGVTWNGAGTISYYHPATATTPIATLSVSALSGGGISGGNPFEPYNSPVTVTFNSTAPGTGCGGYTIGYQWEQQLGTTNSNPWTAISGATSASYTVSGSFVNSYMFRRGAFFIGGPSGTVYTGTYPLLVPGAGTVTPATQTISANGTPTALTASSPQNCNGQFLFQWQSSPDGSPTNFQPVTTGTGGTTLTYSPTTPTASAYYYRLACSCAALNSTVYTNTAAINVTIPLVSGTVSPATQAINPVTVAGPLTATAASGGNGVYTYQWMSSPTGVAGSFSNVTTGTGATSLNYSPGVVSSNTWYELAVTSNGGTVFSNVASITMSGTPVYGVNAPNNSTGTPDNNLNWIIARNFDDQGNTLSETKQFYDNMGAELQSQARVKYRKNATTVYTHVIASQPMPDAYGRPAASSMGAPIDNSEFSYQPNFIRAPDGSAYTYKNFDRFNPSGTETDKTISPDQVGVQSARGTLAWYYSTSNYWEPYTPTTNYPYSRQTYYRDGTSNQKKVGGKGETFVMGSGRETSGYMAAAVGELTNYLAVRNNVFSTTQVGALNTTLQGNSMIAVDRDANGNEIVTISDSRGRPLMTGRPGTDLMVSNIFSLTNPDGALPSTACFKVLADNTSVSITGSYTLYRMDLEPVTTVAAGVLPRGYYKVVANSGTVTVSYSNGFTDVCYYFYNQLGEPVATVPPNGTKLLFGTGYTAYSTLASLPFVTTYSYNPQGKLVSTTTPDEGTGKVLYRMDGSIRFTQNAAQAASGSYSYTDYDAYNRAIETGQASPGGTGPSFASLAGSALLETIGTNDGLSGCTKTDVVSVTWDLPDATHGQANYTQDPIYLQGAVSTMKRYSTVSGNSPSPVNLVSQSWYNYDEDGKVLWNIKYIASLGPTLGIKTTDFGYDVMGRLIKKLFQKYNSSESFVHYFQFDAITGNLWKVWTNTADLGIGDPSTLLQANYVYYLHGGLKRVELGANVQGIDYTYTLQGALKSINNANAAADPGNDAVGTTGFNPDIFGETLDYYTNDYLNARTTGIPQIKGIDPSVAADSYVGNIKDMSWYSGKPAGGSSSPQTFLYSYDPKYQLVSGTSGVPGFSNNPVSFTPNTINKETRVIPAGLPGAGNPSYDANGNIQYLQRTDPGGLSFDQLAYTYTPNSNKLATTVNTGAQPLTTNYSFDPAGRETSETTGSSATSKYLQYDASGRVTSVVKDAVPTPVAQFVYDEVGERIEKLMYSPTGQLQQVTYYFGDVVFTQPVTSGPTFGTLSPQEYQIAGLGGRIGVYLRQQGTGGTYVYQLTDHQGNTRAVIAKSGTPQSATDYYPSGLVSATVVTGTPYRYGYQGANSEADAETGWNSFELRMYNPKISRWTTVDPHAQFNSPYIGMGNDPAGGVDPNGADWVTYQDENGHWQTQWDDDVVDAASAKAWGDEAQWLGKSNVMWSNVDGLKLWALNPDGSPTLLFSFGPNPPNVPAAGGSADVNPGGNPGVNPAAAGAVGDTKSQEDEEAYKNRADWLDHWAQRTGSMALGSSAVELSIYTKLPGWAGGKGWWLGENGYNAVRWGGNQWTGARNLAKLASERVGMVTKAVGGLAVVVSVAQAVNDFSNGHTKAGVIHSLDAVMGVVGFLGPIGAGISGVYFVSRFFWGNDD